MAFTKKIMEILKSPKLREVVEGGIDAAATPNIADGGATDLFRALQSVDAGRLARRLASIQPFVKQADVYATTARGKKAEADIEQGERKIGQEDTKIRETGRHNKATEGLTSRGQDIGVNTSYQDIAARGVPYGMVAPSRSGYESGETLKPAGEGQMSPVIEANVEGRKASTDYTKQLGEQSGATTEATKQNTEMAPRRLENEERRTDAMVSRANAAVEKERQDAAGGGTLPPKVLDSARKIGNDLNRDPAYKDMLDIENGINSVETGLSQGNGFGDITAINGFQRMVDPGATVRSEDVRLLQEASAWIARIAPEHVIAKLKTGDKLPPAVRDQMRQTAQELYNRRAGYYNESVGARYKQLSTAHGIPDFSLVGRDFPIMGSQPQSVPVQSGGATYNIPAEMLDQFRATHPDAQVVQ